MERLAEIFLEMGYRRLPAMTVTSVEGIKGFIELYEYPVFIEVGKHQFVVKDQMSVEAFDKVKIDEAFVKKYFENGIGLEIEYHSEYNIVSLVIEKGDKKADFQLNPLVSLTAYKIKKNAPEVGDFVEQICDCYNMFLDNNYKSMLIDLYREKGEIYFSLRKMDKKRDESYDDIAIIYNVKTAGEYVNDLFKRYGKHAHLVPIDRIENALSHSTHIFIIIVNDSESKTEKYMDILRNISSFEKQFYCMFEGIDDKKVKGMLMKNNIIFMNDPYTFIKTVING